MPTIPSNELLKDKDILNEISVYKWLASEKEGQDIGFERASREWINTYSQKYLAQHPGKSTIMWVKSQPIVAILNKEIKF